MNKNKGVNKSTSINIIPKTKREMDEDIRNFTIEKLIAKIDHMNLDLARKVAALKRIAAWDFDVAIDRMAAARNAARAVLSDQDDPIVCDGCRVRQPWEHACHRENAQIAGERVGLPCQCEQCNPKEEEAPSPNGAHK